jgi:iron(III) transport system permease protein
MTVADWRRHAAAPPLIVAGLALVVLQGFAVGLNGPTMPGVATLFPAATGGQPGLSAGAASSPRSPSSAAGRGAGGPRLLPGRAVCRHRRRHGRGAADHLRLLPDREAGDRRLHRPRRQLRAQPVRPAPGGAGALAAQLPSGHRALRGRDQHAGPRHPRGHALHASRPCARACWSRAPTSASSRGCGRSRSCRSSRRPSSSASPSSCCSAAPGLTQLGADLFDIRPTRWVYGLPGILMAQVLAFAPITFLVLLGTLEAINPTLEEASKTLGARPAHHLPHRHMAAAAPRPRRGLPAGLHRKPRRFRQPHRAGRRV